MISPAASPSAMPENALIELGSDLCTAGVPAKEVANLISQIRERGEIPAEGDPLRTEFQNVINRGIELLRQKMEKQAGIGEQLTGELAVQETVPQEIVTRAVAEQEELQKRVDWEMQMLVNEGHSGLIRLAAEQERAADDPKEIQRIREKLGSPGDNQEE